MRVLILGGTGAMGVQLSKILADRGEIVYVTSRSKRVSENPSLTFIQGNAKDDQFLSKLLSKVHTWDCIVDFMVYRTEEFKSRVDLLLSSTNHYLFLSSSRVYADSPTPLTEESPRLLDASHDQDYLQTDEYALTKSRQENILRESGQTNWTIIRPYITYGTYRLQLGTLEKETWLRRALNGKEIPFSEEMLEKQTTVTWGYDVAQVMSRLIGNPVALGQAYHITTPESITWREVLALYRDILSRHGIDLRVKEVSLDTFLTSQHARYQVLYDRMYDRLFDSSKARSDSGYDQFKDPTSGLREALEDFIKNPRFISVNWYTEGRMDRVCGENQKLNHIPGLKDKIAYAIARYLPYKVGQTVWSFITQMRRITRS